MDAIQSKTLRTLKLPVPPMPQQIDIFDRYNAVTEKINVAKATLAKMKKQKTGLMHDLLTSKVSVNVDEPEAQPEAAGA